LFHILLSESTRWFFLSLNNAISIFDANLNAPGKNKLSLDLENQMNKNELAKKVYEISYRRGMFLLRSGQTSTEYFDKYRFESQPALLTAIAELMAPMIPKDTQILAGLEMGGIPIATALSLKTGIPCTFVRKKAKSYGTCQFAEGLDVGGKKLCIIEDVITTGGQVILSTDDLRGVGAIVENVLCVINRDDENKSGEKKLLENQLSLSSLFTMNELKAFA
jgi:orotate phosphoribosyltransferase